MKPDTRPVCPRCLKRRGQADMRHYDPEAGRWVDLPACKPCLCKGRKTA